MSANSPSVASVLEINAEGETRLLRTKVKSDLGSNIRVSEAIMKASIVDRRIGTRHEVEVEQCSRLRIETVVMRISTAMQVVVVAAVEVDEIEKEKLGRREVLNGLRMN